MRPPRRAHPDLAEPAAVSLDDLDRSTLPECLDAIESRLIAEALEKSAGNKSEAARRLGIKTSALYYKLDKYQLGESGTD